jgi:long-subunit acyl-CoA synthetase (AMP-forming)
MGSGLPAPVAVVVLAETAHKLPQQEIRASLQTTLQVVNGRIESHERLSTIIVVNDEWTVENDLLTPTLKLKRDKLEAKYERLISQQFSEPVVWEA